MLLAHQAADLRSAEIEIQHVRGNQSAMELFRAVCVHDAGAAQSMAADALEDDAILIMPPNFELLHHEEAHGLSDLVQVSFWGVGTWPCSSTHSEPAAHP